MEACLKRGDVMRIFLAMLVILCTVEAHAKMLTCGFGDESSEDRPVRTDVVSEELIGDEVNLELTYLNLVHYSITYSVSKKVLLNEFTLLDHNVSMRSEIPYPFHIPVFGRYVAYVATIHESEKALWCWFED